MLTILPSLRELRAPLAAGYVWIVASYLVFAKQFHVSASSPSALRALRDLASLAGRPAALAAATFIAYIVGTLTEGLMTGVSRWRSELAYDMGTTQRPYESDFVSFMIQGVTGGMARLSEDGRSAVMGRYNINLPARHEGDSNAGVHWLEVVRQIGHRLAVMDLRQIDRIARGFRGSQRDVFDEYDRHRSEAEFRETLVLPLFVLVLVLSSQWTAWWLVTSPLMIIFFRQAAKQRRASDAVVVDAVLLGFATSPSLTQFAQICAEEQLATRAP